MALNFEGAKKAGISSEEFYQAARKKGYSSEEIKEHIKPTKKTEYKNVEGNAFQKIGANISNFYSHLTEEGNPFKKVATALVDPGETEYLKEISDPIQKEKINDLKQFQDLEEREKEENPGFLSPHIRKHFPNYKYEEAIKSGLTHKEIEEGLSAKIPEQTTAQKIGHGVAQLGLGALEMSPAGIAYDISAAPLASHAAQTSAYRETLSEDLERLLIQKAAGQWSPEDQGMYDHIVGQLQDTTKSDPFVRTANVSIQGLAEKATGEDFAPDGIIEHGLRWRGMLSHPEKWKDAYKQILTDPSKVFKAIVPGQKAVRASLVGTTLQMAEEGQFGPTGTIAAAIAADLVGHAPSAIGRVAKNPKKFIAEVTNALTRKNSKKEWIKQIIQDANEAGVQLDAGTITDSNLIRMAQARASQSALSGTALDNFRKDLSGQIIKSYKEIGDNIGALTFENGYQASEAIKDYLRLEENTFPAFKDYKKPARPLEGRVAVQERPLYQQELLTRISPTEFPNDYIAGETLKTAASDIKAPIQEDFRRRWSDFGRRTIEIRSPQAELAHQMELFRSENAGSLLLGESTAEARVLRSVENLINRLTVNGSLIEVSLDELIKTKRTLGDIANWEIGTSDFRTRFKELTGAIDNAVMRTLERASPELLEEYELLKAEYSQFKDIFENKNVQQLFEPKNQNYNHIYNSYISDVDKLRSLEDMMYFNPRGQQIVNQVKRDYAQRVTSRPNLTARDIRNLGQELGPQFTPYLQNFERQRQFTLENPLPRARGGERLGINVPVESPYGREPLRGRGTRTEGTKLEKYSDRSKRTSAYKAIKDKSSDQIMNQMNTVEGIRKLKSLLSTTLEGRELYQQLSRFKIEEVIGNKMKDQLNEQLKIGTFTGLITTSKEIGIMKELLGQEAFDKVRLLQKNAKVLQDSLNKFYNTSKSGTTVADIGLIATGMTGVITGNPWVIISGFGSIFGLGIASRLLADKEFLKYLEQAAMTSNKGRFIKSLEKMRPSIEIASRENVPLYLRETESQISEP
jgi:hypothetical protein